MLFIVRLFGVGVKAKSTVDGVMMIIAGGTERRHILRHTVGQHVHVRKVLVTAEHRFDGRAATGDTAHHLLPVIIAATEQTADAKVTSPSLDGIIAADREARAIAQEEINKIRGI